MEIQKSIMDNKGHFLHRHLTYMESVLREGKEGQFYKLLNSKGIPTLPHLSKEDHAVIDWAGIEPHFQFTFDYLNNEEEIKQWLAASPLAEYEYLITWIQWNDPVIRIKTQEFIQCWDEFNIARGWQGIQLATEDGKYFLEFTDDWCYQLHSNFQIQQ